MPRRLSAPREGAEGRLRTWHRVAYGNPINLLIGLRYSPNRDAVRDIGKAMVGNHGFPVRVFGNF